MQAKHLSLAIILATLSVPAQTLFQTAQQTMDTVKLGDLVSFDISIPEPPRAFKEDGKTFLCYELLITSMDAAPVHLQKVEIYADNITTPYLTQQATTLTTSLLHPALTRTDAEKADKTLLAPGERIIDFVWIELPAGTSAPRQLQHTLTWQRTTSQPSITLPAGSTTVNGTAHLIQSPLRGTNWAAVNGPSNTSQHRRSHASLNGATHFPERFAIDWLQLDANGKSFHGDPADNRSYLCFGQPLHAIADATVTWTRDGIPNGTPGQPINPLTAFTVETLGGNQIILDLGSGIYAAYAHLQPGSLRVKAGDHVKAGDILGLLGNSGNSSEPHLHFQLMNANSTLVSQGIPFTIDKFTVRFTTKDEGESLSLTPLQAPILHQNEIPAENEFTDFLY